MCIGSEESQVPELTDDEKLVIKLLSEKSPIDLNKYNHPSPRLHRAGKGQNTGLSNKKWDIAIKGLRGHNLVKVEKNDVGLFVELV